MESLLAAIARGEESALAALYDETSPWVYGFTRRILRDTEAAEEVTLEVYLQAWRRAAEYSPRRGSPGAWLLTIARSRAIDRLRSTAARARREEPFCEGFDPPSAAIGPPAASAEAERQRLVAEAIASLPREQRRAIELAFFEGLSHGEIAERLGEPLGTVKTRIRLGMMKLRETLKPFEDLG